MRTPPTRASNARGLSRQLSVLGPKQFIQYAEVAISDQYLAITRKWLKIYGHMLQCVWPALNPLSIHVTFTAIVPGAYPGEAKMCKKCGKMANFWIYRLNYWETVEDRWVHAAMLWQALNPLFIHVNLLRLSQGRTQRRPKCALGWLQKLTHVPLAIAILLVITNADCRSACVGFSSPSVCLFVRSITELGIENDIGIPSYHRSGSVLGFEDRWR